ncbi:hypothetical protein [Sphingopyxis flava]|uniref:DUF1376 domain-containing protein n=1 Tax=Sphingopyxis flava TaxID=1507287 RepID=A0A1T5ACN5_9SPHN|nr:hypothetical protein [Sphingopyxis flava]SKB32676.1 hypothetical protein SAMN06295937_1003100 [Sphingopyxis flava]
MSRIRSVHPGFFTDEDIVTVSMAARLCLIGLGIEADDKGVFEWKPVRLKMRLFPVDAVDMAALLDELVEAGLVRDYDFDGRRYGAIRNFRKHQKPKTPNDIHPAPDEILDFVALAAPISEKKRRKPDPFPQKGEKPRQMEDGGWRMESSVPSEPRGDDPPQHQPPAPIDIAKSIFDGGVAMLRRQGFREPKAREIVGKWRKLAASDGIVLSCLSRAQSENPSDLVAWMIAAIASEKGRLNDESSTPGPPADPRGRTERAAMAAFGLDPELGHDPPHSDAARQAPRSDRNRAALPHAGDER